MSIQQEFQFIIRQPIIWVVFIASSLFALLIGLGITNPEISAHQQLTLHITTLQMMTIPLVIAVVAPLILLRDTSANMFELIWITPVQPEQRWLRRLIALITMTGMAFVLSASLMALTFSINNVVEPFAFLSLVKQLLFIALPNIILLSVVAFWLCLSFSSNAITYLVCGAIWMGYIVLSSLNGSPVLAGSEIVSDSLYQTMLLVDPFALTAVIDIQTLPEKERFTNLAINRIGYLVLALFILYFLIVKKAKHSQLNIANEANKAPLFGYISQLINRFPLSQRKVADTTSLNKKQDMNMALQPTVFEVNSAKNQHILWRDLGPLYSQYFKSVVLNKINLALLSIWLVLCFENIASGLGITDTFSQYLPTSIDALNRIAFDLLPGVGTVVCAYWAWQLCTFDKRHGFSEIFAATPTHSGTIVLAHLAIMTSLVILLMASSALGSLAAETMFNSEISVVHYLKQLSLSGTPLILISWLFVSCFHLVKRTSVATGVVLAILIVKFTPLTNMLGLDHPFWDVASAPIIAPDSFWYFNTSITSFKPYLSFWLAFVVTAVLIASVKTHRLTSLSLQPLTSKHKWLSLPIGLVIGLGTMLNQQIWHEAPLGNASKREQWKAKYEKRYQDWQNIPQPSVTHLNASVDIYSSEGYANFNVTYHITNTHDDLIEQVLIGRYGNYDLPKVHFESAQQTDFDSELGQMVFKLEKPLASGESLTFTTQFSVKSNKLWIETLNQAIKPEFSNLRGIPLLPTIGYQPRYELTNNQLRVNYSLPTKQESKPSFILASGAPEQAKYNWITMDTRLSVDEGYAGLTQGELIKTWTQGDRSYYEYSANTAFRAIPTWTAVPFKAKSAKLNNTRVSVLTKHDNEAVDVNLAAMQDTLLWFEQNVQAYSYKQLTLVNSPDLQSTGYALPQIMFIADTVGFRASPLSDAGFDQRYRRAVHETAHQWFGHSIGNGVDSDSAFLIESFAKYIELVLIENHFGVEAMQALVDYETERFTFAETHNYEPANALVDADKSHEEYSKATIVFSKLRKVVGDEAIIQALQQLWKTHKYPQKPAVSMDFVKYLKQAAPNHVSDIETLLLKP